MASSCAKILDRETLPTSSATPTRLGLAQPTRKPTDTKRLVETKDQYGNLIGSVFVDGKYGQTHEDLLEIVRFSKLGHREENGRLEVIVDPHKNRREMAYGKSSENTTKRSTPKFSAEGIDQLENDLMKVMIVIDDKKGRVSIKTKTHIIEKIKTAADFEDDADMQETLTVKCRTIQMNGVEALQGTRSLQLWIFSEEYTKLIANDVPRYYDPRPLRQIDSGAVAAMARHVLTHQTMPKGGWIEENLIKSAKVSRQPSKVRQEVLVSLKFLSQLGIHIKDGRWYLAAVAPVLAAVAPPLAADAPVLAALAPRRQVLKNLQVLN